MTRRSNQQEVKSLIEPVSKYLANNYFDLLRIQGEDIQCSVCLDNIDCKKCFCLIPCGHYYHLCCIMHVKVCPICRS